MLTTDFLGLGSAASRFATGVRTVAPALMVALLLSSCGGNTTESADDSGAAAKAQIEEARKAAEAEADAKSNSKGIGPVDNVEIGPFDAQLAEKGKALFEAKCTACHQLSDKKVVGPGLAGITERRNPTWIMNMIVNPEEMTKKDPIGQELLAEHLTQMTNQNVTVDDARAMLEYLRQNDGAK